MLKTDAENLEQEQLEYSGQLSIDKQAKSEAIMVANKGVWFTLQTNLHVFDVYTC